MREVFREWHQTDERINGRFQILPEMAVTDVVQKADAVLLDVNNRDNTWGLWETPYQQTGPRKTTAEGEHFSTARTPSGWAWRKRFSPTLSQKTARVECGNLENL